MAREYVPRPPIRHVLTPNRGPCVPFCSECGKRITTTGAMEIHNRLRESWLRALRSARAWSAQHQANSGNQEAGAAIALSPIPPLASGDDQPDEKLVEIPMTAFIVKTQYDVAHEIRPWFGWHLPG